jgi:RNA polymerase sigma-70 factor, ECF subfamily
MPDWDEILAREGPLVWRTAYRIVGNRSDADECFQEVFLDAFQASLRSDVVNWPAFLKRIVSARAIDRLRRRIRRGANEAGFDWQSLADREGSPSQTLEDAELSDLLRSALAKLPDNQAQAFSLHVLEDLGYREIAAVMNLSVVFVGVLVHRARKRLRRLMTERSSEYEPMHKQL